MNSKIIDHIKQLVDEYKGKGYTIQVDTYDRDGNLSDENEEFVTIFENCLVTTNSEKKDTYFYNLNGFIKIFIEDKSDEQEKCIIFSLYQ